MKDYRQQLLERDFDAAQKACMKQVKRIQSVLVGEAEISDLQQERGKLEARMEDFADAHAVIYDTLEREDKRIEQNTWYDSLNHGNREALRSLNEKISALKTAKDDHSSISHLQVSICVRLNSRKCPEHLVLHSRREPRWLPGLHG